MPVESSGLGCPRGEPEPPWPGSSAERAKRGSEWAPSDAFGLFVGGAGKALVGDAARAVGGRAIVRAQASCLRRREVRWGIEDCAVERAGRFLLAQRRGQLRHAEVEHLDVILLAVLLGDEDVVGLH